VYHGYLNGLDLTDEAEIEPIDGRDLYRMKREYQKSRTVNVFNTFSLGRVDEVELTRLLNAIELEVNIYPNFSHPESFRRISEAALNVGLCPTHDDYFLKYLESRFGIPYLFKNMPIGIQNTRDWFLEIAERFGKSADAERILQAEEKILQEALAPLRKKLQGK
jgi:nitrogenase molybdenum-iron protein alpha chain